MGLRMKIEVFQSGIFLAVNFAVGNQNQGIFLQLKIITD
jgi:hypothetical protein